MVPAAGKGTARFTVPFVEENIYITFQTQGGGTVGIAAAIAGYFAIIGIGIRFMQFAHERDEAMHVITSQWIENESSAPQSYSA
jgi:hypothetical protein